MSNYTKSTNFATKDNLSPGNPLKIVKGTEIDTEFNNIQTAVATKTDNASANITGGSITGITDLAVADGGTGASTAAGGLNNLLPSQTGNANKYLQTDGTNASWDAVSLSTSDITGTLPVANGGTGVTTSTGTGNVVLSNSPTLVTPALGTPASGTATNLTGLPISTGVSGLGTGVATFLGTPSSANLASAVTDETGSGALVFATSPTLVTPVLGTPASGTLTNATGLPISTGVSGLGTGIATFLGTPSSANLLAAVSDETGTGSLVFATSPTLVTPALGTPSALVGTNITGTASGLTAGNVTTNANLTGAVTSVGNATSLGSFSSANLLAALTDETGTGANVFATSPTLVTPILGTPTSATLTNATGLPLSTGVTGTLPVANGGTGTTTPSIVAGSNVTVTGTWPNQTIAASAGGSGTVTSVAATVPSVFSVSGSPITTSGTLALTYSGTALPVANGGTGQTSYTDGQLLIGNSTGNTLTKATLTAGTNVTITNAAGAITIAASGGGASAATPTALGTVYGKQTTSGGTPYLTAIGYNAGLATTGVGCTAVGVGALTTNSTGANHTAIGYRALYNSTVNDNSTAVGFESMLTNTTGNESTALGYRSLYSQTSAYFNTAIGVQAAYNLTTGDSVTAVGHKALFTNTTGVQNTALGFNALYGNTTASNNTAVGYQAGYTNTTAGSCTYVGQQAGRLNSTGNYMTAVGDTALNSATGASNTAVGFQAGYGVTSGANSVYIGSECGGAIGTGSFNVIIGAIAATTATGSNNTYVGRAAANSSTSGNSNSGFGMNCLVNLTTGANNVAIGQAAGTQAGVVDITSQDNYITIGNNTSSNAYIKIAWTVTSDARDKTEVQPVPHGLSFVNQLNPVSFKFKTSREDATPTGDVRYGFLAQDILALEGSDSVVIDAKDSENLKYTDQNMTAILVKAIQELKAEFDAYKASHP